MAIIQMRKVFWDDPYQIQLVTRVISVNHNRILFHETIAYSFSGGQESDKAYINGLPVISSEIESNLIYYILQDDHGIAPNDQVCMKIDWQRRYKLMRLHFAAELILELIIRKLNIKKLGHISLPKKQELILYIIKIFILFLKIYSTNTIKLFLAISQ